MKKPLLILTIILVHFSCKENPRPSELHSISKENKSVESRSTKSKDKNMHLAKPRNHEIKTKKKTKEKIENNKLDPLAATKRKISRNQSIPSFRVDSIEQNYIHSINTYRELTCDVKKYMHTNTFNIHFNDTYANSSNNTGLTDGTLFCLRDLALHDTDFSKLIFGRNEGGHTSDEVQIVTANNDQNRIYTLPLSYQERWDGYQTDVESTIHRNMINRKITNRYGWSNMHPDSLAKQARREVLQVIHLHENGEMELMTEEVSTYNMDDLIN